jgi:palmitoyltransferase
MKKLSKHCTICESCFSDYDHHCVFIGKCVAANNMGKFKLFLCLIFGTLIYGLVSSLMNL